MVALKVQNAEKTAIQSKIVISRLTEKNKSFVKDLGGLRSSKQ